MSTKLPKGTTVTSRYWAWGQDPRINGLHFDMRLAIPSTDLQIFQGTGEFLASS